MLQVIFALICTVKFWYNTVCKRQIDGLSKLLWVIELRNESEMASAEDVIDWDEAMQQCGEDEEFLHELLNDFRGELETQLASIAETIQVRIHEH